MKLPLFALLFAVFCALAPAAPPAGAERTALATARALVWSGTLDVASQGDRVSLPGTYVHHGRLRAGGGLGAALALVPSAALGRALERVDVAGRVARAAGCATAAAFAALACVVFLGMLRDDALSPRAALAFTLALACSTPLVWYGRVADGTALQTLLLLLAVRAARAFVASEDRRAALRLGLALGALVVVEPTLLLAALVVVAWCGLHRHAHLRVAVALRVVAPLAAGIALVALQRWHVGAVAEPMGSLTQGLDGLLLSTGKSVLLYAPLVALAPPALVWMWRTRRADAQLTLAVTAAVLLAAAQLSDWHGDPTWGPRRALPIVPLAVEAVALAWTARATRRRATVAALLVALGVGVQTLGVTIAPTTWLSVADDVRVATNAASWFAEQPSQCHFIPQFSPLVGHAWLLSHLARRDRRLDVRPPYLLLLQNPPKLDAAWSRVQLDWFARTWPVNAAAAWLGALALVGGAAAWRLRRVLR